MINNKEETGNGFGIAGFVLGLIAILSFGGFLLLPILGLIFSIIQLRKKSTGLAIAGLILNILGIIIFIIVTIWIVLTIVFIASVIESIPEFEYCAPVELKIDTIDTELDTVTITLQKGGNYTVTGLGFNVDSMPAYANFPEDKSLKESETKTYNLDKDIKEDDYVRAYPIINVNGQSIHCPNSAFKTA